MSFITDFRFALRSLGQGQRPGDHRRRHPGAWHRRQCRDFQRRPRRAPAAARQPRRRPPDLHPPERARHRCGERELFGPGDPGPAIAHPDAQRVRRFLDRRVHDGRPGRAPRRSRRGRRRVVLQRHGPPPGAGPPARRHRRRAQGCRRGRADASLLDDHAAERRIADRKDREAWRTLRRPSSASSSRPSRIPRRRRSSRTS